MRKTVREQIPSRRCRKIIKRIAAELNQSTIEVWERCVAEFAAQFKAAQKP